METVEKYGSSVISAERTREILRGFCILILTNRITNFAELYTYTEDAPDDVFDVFCRKSAFLNRMCEANAQRPGLYKSKAEDILNEDTHDNYWGK